MISYRDYKQNLLTAIENHAKVDAAYLQTQPIKVSEDGNVLWKGKVEVYQLKNHPQAKMAFGWGYMNAQKKIEYIVVIGIPPLDTPLAAVKAFVGAHRK